MKQVVIGFGLFILALLILFHLPHISPFDSSNNEIWIAIFSILFLVIGIVLSRKLFTKTLVVAGQSSSILNYDLLLKSGISKREADILLLIDDGLSNQQIADKLFISENTVKKHISNLFLKLGVERRTEAIKKAKELSAGIQPRATD